MTTGEFVAAFFASSPPATILEVDFGKLEARTLIGRANARPVWVVQSLAGVRFEVTCSCCRTCVLLTTGEAVALLARDREQLRVVDDWFARLGHVAEVLS